MVERQRQMVEDFPAYRSRCTRYEGTDRQQVTYEESTGAKVSPESLYEAQLRERLGYVPGWLNALK